MTRSVPEWIGKNDDVSIPMRVRLRVFEAHGGICGISGRKITPADDWQIDHIIALANGGEHRENNLQPVLAEPHKVKTRTDVARKAKSNRVRAKHLTGRGTARKGPPMPGSRDSQWKRKIDGTVERRT